MPSSGVDEARKLQLKLYGRSYCHLCDEMLAALAPLREEFGFTIELVDVDADAALEQRFGILVPVLMHADTELCHYHLDAAIVRAYLAKLS
ncbi:MAG: glutaredoxin family protein [Burkholderiales bacterium]|nr:glutaredoxin family protein [Burkholderiales bacterium]